LRNIKLPYFPDHKAYQDFRRQIQGENIDAPSDHETQGTLYSFLEGKKCVLWSGKYGVLYSVCKVCLDYEDAVLSKPQHTLEQRTYFTEEKL
jgi:hypothetical protein